MVKQAVAARDEILQLEESLKKQVEDAQKQVSRSTNRTYEYTYLTSLINCRASSELLVLNPSAAYVFVMYYVLDGYIDRTHP